MQTFLPYPNYVQSVSVLDARRLGNQRNEAKVILRTLLGELHGWKKHPAVKMWEGAEWGLACYLSECIAEWKKRGHTNHIVVPKVTIGALVPSWLGREDVHASHRSQLLEKDPEWYGQFCWTEEPGLPYVWPIQKEEQNVDAVHGHA